MSDRFEDVQATLLEIEESDNIDLSKGELTAKAITVIGQLAQLQSSNISLRSVRDTQRIRSLTRDMDGARHVEPVGKTTFMLKIEYDGDEWKRRFGRDINASK